MIELSIYLWTVGILSTIIVLFVAHYLREPRIKSVTSELKKQKSELIAENTAFQKKDLNSEEQINEQQKTIANQETKISIFSKYTFDRSMGCLKSRADSKLYCTACLLQFKEIPLQTNRNPFQCMTCGAEYIKK